MNGTIEFSCPVKPSTVAKTTSILLHPSSSSMIPFYSEPAKPSMVLYQITCFCVIGCDGSI